MDLSTRMYIINIPTYNIVSLTKDHIFNNIQIMNGYEYSSTDLYMR